MGFICKYVFGMCAIGKLMSFKGGDGEGPQAVAEPQNCFVCCLLGNYCSCCNYGACSSAGWSPAARQIIVSRVREQEHSHDVPPHSVAHPARPLLFASIGKYRAHNNIDGSPVNDFIATCILATGTCQMLNDYELKNNGKFGMLGAWAKNEGSPATQEMSM